MVDEQRKQEIIVFLLPSLLVFHSHIWDRDWISWFQEPRNGVQDTSTEASSVHNNNFDNSREWDSSHNEHQKSAVFHNPSRHPLKLDNPFAGPGTKAVPFTISNSFSAASLRHDRKKHAYKISNQIDPESDLRRARASLRSLMLKKHNISVLDVSRIEPFGPAYKNAAIFRQSYLEMERHFKIFVYPEGEEPIVHNGPCKGIYSIEGRFIREFQSGNFFVTADPEKAHVFFLPYSVANMVAFLFSHQSWDLYPLIHFVRDYIEVVAANYPFWNRSQGGDHFMLSCHDWGPMVSKAHPNLEKNGIRVLCNANISEGFIPMKDATLPEINLYGGIFDARIGGPPADKRAYLAFFAGGNHGPVRPKLFKYWEGKDDDMLVFRTLPKNYSYHQMMKNSKYCICPGGYEVNSPRIVEAIYNECVPVILADGFALPFSDVLDWKTFSLHLPEKDIPNLKRILSEIPKQRYEEMQARVRQIQRHFVLNEPSKRYDVLHMILHSVWLRRLNKKIIT